MAHGSRCSTFPKWQLQITNSYLPSVLAFVDYYSYIFIYTWLKVFHSISIFRITHRWVAIHQTLFPRKKNNPLQRHGNLVRKSTVTISAFRCSSFPQIARIASQPRGRRHAPGAAKSPAAGSPQSEEVLDNGVSFWWHNNSGDSMDLMVK